MSISIRNSRRVAVALIALVLTASASAASASAADTVPGNNHDLATITESHVGPNRLSVADAVAGAPTPAAAAALGQVATTATSCWYFDDSRTGKDLVGITLFTFRTRTNWCGDGSWIRSYAYTTTSASTFVGWKYYGLTINQDKYGVNWNMFESIREGQFCLLNCLAQNIHPYIDVKVGPAGQIYHT